MRDRRGLSSGAVGRNFQTRATFPPETASGPIEEQRGDGAMAERRTDWERLVLEQEDRLYRAALAILGSVPEAEDAVQDTFLTFWEKAPADQIGRASCRERV